MLLIAIIEELHYLCSLRFLRVLSDEYEREREREHRRLECLLPDRLEPGDLLPRVPRLLEPIVCSECLRPCSSCLLSA